MSTGILITVRLKSERLPKKALQQINGKPLLQHLVDRMKASSVGHNLAIITSNLPDDAPLLRFASQNDIKAFAGDPQDVLVRIRDAATEFGYDRIVSVTGDNPFVDPKCMEQALDFQAAHQLDFVSISGIPWGTFCYILTASGVRTACERKSEKDTEVWGDYFRKNPELKCGVMAIEDPELVWPELRLTVDTPDDLSMVRAIASSIDDSCPNLRQIIQYCREHPEVVAINSEVQQKPAKPAAFVNQIE